MGLFSKDRPDSVLFDGMSRSEMHDLTRKLADGASRLHVNGDDDTAIEAFQACADLNAAWWRDFDGHVDEKKRGK